MTAIDRAGEIIGKATFETPWRVKTHEVDLPANTGTCLMYLEANGVYAIAQALADAGLFVTDEAQAVLDYVVEWRTSLIWPAEWSPDLVRAIDAYLESRQVAS